LRRFAALVESVALMIAVNAGLLSRQAGVPRRVVLAGGMSRSGWLARRLAALIERPVEILEAEASARGVAQLAAPDVAASWQSAPVHSYAPHPHAQLRTRLQRYCELMGGAA
jgi:sugar (pentulose or hexulose) kinase